MRDFFQRNCVDLKTPIYDVREMEERINFRQIFIGFSILLLGAAFYYFSRPAEHTYFLKLFGVNHYMNDSLSSLFAVIGDSLPTFIHVFAFTLMTAGLIARNKGGYVIVCLFWFGTDALFETAQIYGNWVSQIIPNWFSSYLFLENVRSYFLKGRFDYFDLISIALGALTAYVFLLITKNDKEESK